VYRFSSGSSLLGTVSASGLGWNCTVLPYMFRGFFKPIFKRHCVQIWHWFLSPVYGVSDWARLEQYSFKLTRTLTPCAGD
jgi:hypothetical protein